MHHEGGIGIGRAFSINKLDWVIVGNSESNTMRFVVRIVVVIGIGINIIRKRH